MSHHRLEVSVPVPATAVLRVLEARPTTWLRPFLRLAAARAAKGALPPGPPTWYRLGVAEPDPDGTGTSTLRFNWWPHLRGGLFESFKGRFVVHPAGGGTVVRLEGTATGGTAERNATVLRAVLDLLAGALSADQGPTPG